MDTWRLVDVQVFFTFFAAFSSAPFFSFWGALQIFFRRTPPLRQPIGPYRFCCFSTLCWLFLYVFSGGLGNCSLLKIFFFYPDCPSLAPYKYGGIGVGYIRWFWLYNVGLECVG